MDFDETWLTIEGQTIPFYVIESTDKYTKALIPAYLNDEYVELVAYWDYDDESGTVVGAQKVDEYGETTLSSKNLIKLQYGDKIEFVYDYYDYDGDYDASYLLYDPIIIESNNLEIYYDDIDENSYYFYYKITDIYGNEYYTETMVQN